LAMDSLVPGANIANLTRGESDVLDAALRL
jgi:hypothetical protein